MWCFGPTSRGAQRGLLSIAISCPRRLGYAIGPPLTAATEPHRGLKEGISVLSGAGKIGLGPLEGLISGRVLAQGAGRTASHCDVTRYFRDRRVADGMVGQALPVSVAHLGFTFSVTTTRCPSQAEDLRGRLGHAPSLDSLLAVRGCFLPRSWSVCHDFGADGGVGRGIRNYSCD